MFLSAGLTILDQKSLFLYFLPTLLRLVSDLGCFSAEIVALKSVRFFFFFFFLFFNSFVFLSGVSFAMQTFPCWAELIQTHLIPAFSTKDLIFDCQICMSIARNSVAFFVINLPVAPIKINIQTTNFTQLLQVVSKSGFLVDN